MHNKDRTRTKLPQSDVIDAVSCPTCCADKGERCRVYSPRPFGIETGSERRPHRERIVRYRRRLAALRITRPL